METLGQRLKSAREQKRLSPYDLAAKVGVNHNTIRSYESDKIKRINYELIDKLSIELETSIEYLLKGVDSVIKEPGLDYGNIVDYLKTELSAKSKDMSVLAETLRELMETNKKLVENNTILVQSTEKMVSRVMIESSAGTNHKRHNKNIDDYLK